MQRLQVAGPSASRLNVGALIIRIGCWDFGGAPYSEYGIIYPKPCPNLYGPLYYRVGFLETLQAGYSESLTCRDQ